MYRVVNGCYEKQWLSVSSSPLQHPEQLPALERAVLVEVDEGRVSGLVQEGAVRCVVLGQLQQAAPDKRSGRDERRLRKMYA